MKSLVEIANRKLKTKAVLQEIQHTVEDLIDKKAYCPISELNKYLRNCFLPRVDSVAAVSSTESTLAIRAILNGASYILKFRPNIFYKGGDLVAQIKTNSSPLRFYVR